MGTQQILLIVLSVIIVGAAVAVGIDMFNRQDYTSNRSAAASDVQIYLTQVLQYYKMPTQLGGLGKELEAPANESDTNLAKAIASYIGWGTDNPMKNDNAYYYIEVPTGTEEVVYIKAISQTALNGKRASVHGRITFPEGKIESRVGDIDDITSGSSIEASDFAFDNFTTGD